MTKRIRYLLAGGAVMAFALGGLCGQGPSGGAGAAQPVGGDPNAADREAIKQSVQDFLKAFMSGDAKGVAAHWTENGEYQADDGTTLRGRAAIEKAYAKLFAKKKGKVQVELEPISLRFPSKDTAIGEGYFKVRVAGEAPAASKYSVLHVREGGKWLIALLREFPGEAPSLHDLEWLIGSWQAKTEDTEVQTTYEWWGDKSFLHVKVAIKTKDHTVKGFQMIGKDNSTGQLRSWLFDEGGSFGESTWSQDGKKWMLDSAAVLEDGSVLAATNILTWIDNDTFTFQSVNRTLDGEDLDDIPPVRVTRVKGK
jgi:uncharacterized protein (TIGR02246 family)